MASADTVMRMTWISAASASALPWPKRCSASAGIAAQRTPRKVTMLATRSSAVSARLPSIATEPVSQLAQTFSATRNSSHGHAGHGGAPGQLAALGAVGALGMGVGVGVVRGSRVEQAFVPAAGRAREQPALVQPVRPVGPEFDAARNDTIAAPVRRPWHRLAVEARLHVFVAPFERLAAFAAGATGRTPRRRAGNRGRGLRNRRPPRCRARARPGLRSAPGGAGTSSGRARPLRGLSASSPPLRLSSLV